MRRFTISTTTAAVSIAAILTLGACSSPTASHSERDETGSAPDVAQPTDSSEDEVEVEVDLPSGWPPELPAPRGELFVGTAQPDFVSANFRMNDMDDVERLFADFIAAGYELLAESNVNGTLARGFANDTFRVNISVTPDGDEFSLTYVAVPA